MIRLASWIVGSLLIAALAAWMISLPGALTLLVVHDLCEQVEKAIIAEYPKAEVLVHADPQEVVRPASA